MERSAAAWWWRTVARLDGGQVGHEADELLEEVEDVGADATDDEGQGVVGLLGAQVLGEVADDVAERDDGTREAQRAAGGAERVTDRLQRRAAGLAEKVPAPTPARTPDGSAAAASPDHLPLVALPCMYLCMRRGRAAVLVPTALANSPLTRIAPRVPCIATGLRMTVHAYRRSMRETRGCAATQPAPWD